MIIIWPCVRLRCPLRPADRLGQGQAVFVELSAVDAGRLLHDVEVLRGRAVTDLAATRFGSRQSRHALEYAVSEAVRRDAALRVVSVFESAGKFGARYGVPIPVSDPELPSGQRRQWHQTLSDTA